ncbi:YihY/virulence factor BrkB family protein [Lactobacillus sp. PV034]|uniref:YihY/virulence factor BrkB family protein n=1 Tax=Lactobacillus sp. PV034 TaxID=2594495 RepID=UPI0022405D3A|nr:YihY/virulence factor BrkB family protein [Lactobacillus sp. PV034]QNQ80764.1 YihY/virulence factor BrkB family protein [Lactobacillus sp. PV034]
MNTSNVSKKIKLYFNELVKTISQGEINQHSIIIAYYALFSIFPIIIIVGNILPLFKIDTRPIADYLSLIFPAQVSKLVIPIITTLLKQHSSGFISFGIIVSIWSFSGLTNSIRLAMNKIYGVDQKEKQRAWWYTFFARTVTFLVTVLLVLSFSGVMFVFAFGRQIMEFLVPVFGFSLAWVYKIESYKWPLIILMIVIVVLYVNLVLPNIDTAKRRIWPGVWVTTISWLGLSYGFGWYLRNFGIRWQNYGIIGSFIVFMFWLNLGALLLLFGVCINAASDQLKYGETKYSTSSLISFYKRRRDSSH